MGFGSGVLGWVMTLEDHVSAKAKVIGTSLNTLRNQGMLTSQGLMMVGTAMTGVGVGLGAILAKGTKDAIGYEGQLKMLGAITKMTGEEQEAFGKQIDDMTAELPLSSKGLAKMAIVAGKLGMAGKVGKDGLLEISREAALLGSTLGFAEDATVGFIGKTGAVFGLFDKNKYSAEEMIKNTKGVSAALMEMSFNSARSADFLSDVAVRAGGGAKAMQLSAAQVIGLAGALGDSGIQAQAAGMNLGNLAKKMITDKKAFHGFMKEVGGAKAAKKWLVDMAEDPAEAFTSLLELMGQLQDVDPQGAVIWTKELTKGSSRMALVMDALAQKGFKGATQEMSDLRRMLKMSTDTFEKGKATSEAYNRVSKGVGMQMKVLTGSIENVAKGLGNVFLPVLRDDVLPILVAVAGALVKMDAKFYKTVGTVIAIVAGFTTLGGVVLLASGIVIMFGAAIWAALWPATIIIGAVALAVGGVYLALQGVKKEGETTWDVVKGGAKDAEVATTQFAKGFGAQWEAQAARTEENMNRVTMAVKHMLVSLGLMDEETAKATTGWREIGEVGAAALGSILEIFSYGLAAIPLAIHTIAELFWNLGDVFQTTFIIGQKGLMGLIFASRELNDTISKIPLIGRVAGAMVEFQDDKLAGLQTGLEIMEEMQKERRKEHKSDQQYDQKPGFFRAGDTSAAKAIAAQKKRAAQNTKPGANFLNAMSASRLGMTRQHVLGEGTGSGLANALASSGGGVASGRIGNLIPAVQGLNQSVTTLASKIAHQDALKSQLKDMALKTMQPAPQEIKFVNDVKSDANVKVYVDSNPIAAILKKDFQVSQDVKGGSGDVRVVTVGGTQ